MVHSYNKAAFHLQYKGKPTQARTADLLETKTVHLGPKGSRNWNLTATPTRRRWNVSKNLTWVHMYYTADERQPRACIASSLGRKDFINVADQCIRGASKDSIVLSLRKPQVSTRSQLIKSLVFSKSLAQSHLPCRIKIMPRLIQNNLYLNYVVTVMQK